MKFNTARMIPIDSIRVKDRSRTDLGDIDSLAETIQSKGLIQPITVDQNNNLLSGERRLRAHQRLGLTEIMAITRQVDGIVDAMEVELIENIARKDFNWQERARLEARLMEFRQKLDPHWTQDKQAKMTGASVGGVNRRLQLAGALEVLPELSEFNTEDDAYKAYKKMEEGIVLKMMKDRVPAHVTEAINKAAEHYLIGNALEEMERLPGGTFDFAEVDPPYGVDLHRRRSRNEDTSHMETYVEWDDFETKFIITAGETFRLLKPHSFAVFWYGMSWHSQVLNILREVGFGVPDIPAVWYKGNAGQTASPDTTWGSCYEPFFLARKGQPKMARPGRGNVFQFSPLQKKVHATEKPLMLIKEIMNVVCFPGSNILCPFLGSGVTLRAAYRLGHTGVGWDLSQEHKNGFLKRVQDDLEKKDDNDSG